MITAHPSAPLGTILRPQEYSASLFLPGSVILCRNTAPLVSFCYNLLSRDVPCRIAGKDIGKGLTDLVKSFKTDSINALLNHLQEWRHQHTNLAIEEGRSPEQYEDKYFAILTMADRLVYTTELISRIDRIFSDEDDGSILLSTIHRFKGGESSRVFLLDFDRLLPSRYAKTPKALQQERNLQYVAVTRSFDTLIFIESDRWEDSSISTK